MAIVPQRYIGLMSGTSIDGIDAALIEISPSTIKLRHSHSQPIPASLRQQLLELCQPGHNEIQRLGEADHLLGLEFANAVNSLLFKHRINPLHVTAIGSHGQTIRHQPLKSSPFTLQIGDANIISHKTGICTVADFRRRDMAAGGQGAPLAPAFHQAAFGDRNKRRIIVNIGGMANITPLIDGIAKQGFDTGPGNVLMDYWIGIHQAKHYDHGGKWAASGTIIPPLFNSFMADNYFSLPAPKSTGREHFNPRWLEQLLGQQKYPAADVQATLLELTATSISDQIRRCDNALDEVYICGGGAYNRQLMNRINAQLQGISVNTTELLGIAPEWVEAAAFAWLAHQTLSGLSGNIPAATGASQACILGAIYPV